MKVLVTGGHGMLGSSIVSQWRLQRPTEEIVAIGSADIDLRDRQASREFIEQVAPDAIIHAAARVNGIAAKLAEPTTYLLDNLLIDTSVLSAAIDLRIPELLYVGSAAIYPAQYVRPYVEADVLTGTLEPANEGYAISKIAAGKICEYASRQFGLNFRVAVPSNLYGPHDHFDLTSAHLIAATLIKVHNAVKSGARTVEVWGDGSARREFTFSVDVASWLVGQIGNLANWPRLLNLGCGVDHSVAEFYAIAKEVVGFHGEFEFDPTKPAGVPQRLINSSAARGFGWDPRTTMHDGMAATYKDYLTTYEGQDKAS